VFDAEPTYNGKTDTWLLLHENPVSQNFMSGKDSSELNYMIELSEQTEGSLEEGETALHVAARNGSEIDLSNLLLGDHRPSFRSVPSSLEAWDIPCPCSDVDVSRHCPETRESHSNYGHPSKNVQDPPNWEQD
jgi:hypothetical protein